MRIHRIRAFLFPLQHAQYIRPELHCGDTWPVGPPSAVSSLSRYALPG